jgi:hypothetical protein
LGGWWFEASLSKKFARPHLNRQAGCGGTCSQSFVGGSWLKANPVQKCVTLSEKITKTKRAGDMVQVVELLPGKP